jgi:hypothetical protein
MSQSQPTLTQTDHCGHVGDIERVEDGTAFNLNLEHGITAKERVLR